MILAKVWDTQVVISIKRTNSKPNVYGTVEGIGILDLATLATLATLFCNLRNWKYEGVPYRTTNFLTMLNRSPLMRTK